MLELELTGHILVKKSRELNEIASAKQDDKHDALHIIT
jgi:hypothetical protein